MKGKQINIDPKEKIVDIYVDDITVSELKNVLNHFNEMNDYTFKIHNPQQTTCLIDVYENDIEIDNLKINE
jgi:LEA14-like dessication related protein